MPEVATAAPAVSNGGRTYRFQIRPGYRFSPPSGQPVTAAAFQRAIERTLHPRSSSFGIAILGPVVGAGAYTRRPRRHDRRRAGAWKPAHDSPDSPGPDTDGTPVDVLLLRRPPEHADPAARAWSASPRRAPSTSPSPRRGSRLLLRRNPSYAGPRPQRLEAIEVKFGVAQERAVPEVEAGRADYAESIPQETQARLLARYGPGSRAAAAGRQQYFAAPVPAIDALVFNSRRSLFAKAATRRAVNYAIDRRALGREPFGGRGGQPTDQHIPPGYPGYRDATIYPLGGPDLATARRLAGGARRRGILYACNLPGCTARAAIVRANLAAIGIELETRQFSIATMHRKLSNPDEPYDLSLFIWGGEVPDPSDFIDVMFSQAAGTGFLDRTRLGQRIRAASRLAGAARLEAYAALDRDIASKAAPFAPYHSYTHADFFSARIGCQTEHPLYGIDLAALCIRD